METHVMTISPAIAELWLKSSVGNRPINKKRVERYAEDMKNGKWRLNGESIKLTKKYELLDGHHRLNAVIKAGVNIKSSVAFGVEKSAMPTIDIGQKRSNSQIFAFEKIKNYSPMSGIINRYLVMKDTDGLFSSQGADRHTPEVLLDLYYENPEFWQKAQQIGSRCEPTRLFTEVFMGAIYAWLVLEGNWDSDVVEKFLLCASNFNDMSIPQAVMLRNTVQKRINTNKAIGVKLDTKYLSSLMAVAFNAMVVKRKLRSINVDFGGWVKFEKNTNGKTLTL